MQHIATPYNTLQHTAAPHDDRGQNCRCHLSHYFCSLLPRLMHMTILAEGKREMGGADEQEREKGRILIWQFIHTHISLSLSLSLFLSLCFSLSIHTRISSLPLFLWWLTHHDLTNDCCARRYCGSQCTIRLFCWTVLPVNAGWSVQSWSVRSENDKTSVHMYIFRIVSCMYSETPHVINSDWTMSWCTIIQKKYLGNSSRAFTLHVLQDVSFQSPVIEPSDSIDPSNHSIHLTLPPRPLALKWFRKKPSRIADQPRTAEKYDPQKRN